MSPNIVYTSETPKLTERQKAARIAKIRKVLKAASEESSDGI